MFKSTASMIRRAFGKNLTDEDIYQHITSPEMVYLLEVEGELSGIASYNRASLSGIPTLIIEGVAISPEMQGKNFFKKMTDYTLNNEGVIGFRTQNSRMYRTAEKYCSKVYPNKERTPEAIKAIRKSLARHLNCETDENGIIRKYYGGLFYGEEPTHDLVTPFFKNCLGMHLELGDALIVVGVKDYKEELSQQTLKKITKEGIKMEGNRILSGWDKLMGY